MPLRDMLAELDIVMVPPKARHELVPIRFADAMIQLGLEDDIVNVVPPTASGAVSTVVAQPLPTGVDCLSSHGPANSGPNAATELAPSRPSSAHSVTIDATQSDSNSNGISSASASSANSAPIAATQVDSSPLPIEETQPDSVTMVASSSQPSQKRKFTVEGCDDEDPFGLFDLISFVQTPPSPGLSATDKATAAASIATSPCPEISAPKRSGHSLSSLCVGITQLVTHAFVCFVHLWG